MLSNDFNAYVNYLKTGGTGSAYSFGKAALTVNIAGLSDSPAQYNAAILALKAWNAATGLTFTVTTAAKADITIDNEDASGAYTSWSGVNGKITHADINVAKNWMDGFPTSQQWGVGSYGVQTFIHEIGHALGLHHGGPYDGFAEYAVNAIFGIDTNQYSVMSYFEQGAYAASHATSMFISSPMMADIKAIADLYGSNLSINKGDTLYGAGETALGGISDLEKHPHTAFTISDTSGNDTLDFHNAKTGSLIDLTPGHFSNVNGDIGNVGIAYGTVIEKAIGTHYGDTIYGNDANNILYGLEGNDTINGGAGNDRIYGGAGADQLTGGKGADNFVFQSLSDSSRSVFDTIHDFSVKDGDRIDLSAIDANIVKAADQAFSFIGSALFSGILGQLRYDSTANHGTDIYGDVNGDRVADLRIHLDGAISLQKGYFIL